MVGSKQTFNGRTLCSRARVPIVGLALAREVHAPVPFPAVALIG